jgi:hypothetical protein
MIVAVSTGLDSFSNPQDIGPMYPFVGQEWLFVVIAVLLWLAWHFLQARGETSEHHDAVEMYDRIGLDRAMHHGGSALIATDDEWAAELRTRGAAEPPPRTGAP